MKPKKNVSYFPVSGEEQALLLRMREPDLAGRLEEILDMLDQIADTRLSPADLEQAIQLLLAIRQSEAIDARFDNLEARLKERIEKGLAEIEGRFSRRLGGEPPGTGGATGSPLPPPKLPATDELPKEASIAFRIGPEIVWGPSAAQFYIGVWRWLFDHGHAKASDLPIQSGKKRYVAATRPVHPSGKEFARAEEPVLGVFVEVNLSRVDIIRRAKKYLGQYGVAFEVLVGAE
jgi:hypothetical protein